VPASRIEIRELPAEAALALGYSLAFIALSAAIPWLIANYPLRLWGVSDYLQDFWYAIVFKIVFLLAVPSLCFLRRGYGLRDVLLGWRPLPASVLAVLAAFAAGALLNADRAEGIGRALDAMPAAAGLGRVAVGAVLALLMAGLPEELFYRCILQTRLEKAAGRLTAVAVTALLFTAWHIPPRFAMANGIEGRAGHLGSVLIGTGVPVLLVAIVFGLAWDRWRNLPALVAAHWGIDLLPVVGSLLQIPPK
jgi:membrane protease YdiL (CAAX protease family)